MILSLIQEDIDAALAVMPRGGKAAGPGVYPCKHCPVTQAFRRQTGVAAAITTKDGYIYPVHGDMAYEKPPSVRLHDQFLGGDDMREFIAKFDKDGTAVPAIFQLRKL